MRSCTQGVVTLYVVSVCRPQPYARSIVELQHAARLLLLRNLQLFTTPDSRVQIRSSILADLPTSSLQQCCHTVIAVMAVLTCKLDDGLRERILVFAPDDTVALGAAWLVDQSARSPLRHPCFCCAWSAALRRRSGLKVSGDDTLPPACPGSGQLPLSSKHKAWTH